ncbi:MAG: glycosyltransferase family 4 protein [Bryobacterales bacterium]|nr:glycosyltransferase family 4 protein [Bryobacterales bacterium]
MRILYIQASVVPPPSNPSADRFALLSQQMEGDVLQPVWFRDGSQVESVFGPGSYPVYQRGRFRYHWVLHPSDSGLRGKVGMFWKILRKGVQLHRESPFECIIAYSHMTIGLMGLLVKLFTGARLAIEIVTMPQRNHLSRSPKVTIKDRISKAYSDLCLHITVWGADRLHFLYPGQLNSYRWLRHKANSVFHEFVPTSLVPRKPPGCEESFVFFVGAPWYLKGVDILVQAFRRIGPDYPGWKLKLQGHFPDHGPLRQMIGATTEVEVLKATTNERTLELMSRASVLVLPSRCEGMPRVLLEAMAAGVPVIGSDIGGIPFLLSNGQAGLLVSPGDVGELEAGLRKLLSDRQLREDLGERGYRRAHGDLNETVYVNEFAAMVKATIARATV